MQPNQAPESAATAYPFTAEELARLSTYKVAVEAGFYSDACADRSSFEDIFTMQERQRLAIYRAAIKARFYIDFSC